MFGNISLAKDNLSISAFRYKNIWTFFRNIFYQHSSTFFHKRSVELNFRRQMWQYIKNGLIFLDTWQFLLIAWEYIHIWNNSAVNANIICLGTDSACRVYVVYTHSLLYSTNYQYNNIHIVLLSYMSKFKTSVLI